MKKRRTFVIIMILVFLLGVIAASQDNYSHSQYFEQSKEQFENEIQQPNNNYNPKKITPEASFSTKAAQAIDEKITNVCQTVIKKIASFFE